MKVHLLLMEPGKQGMVRDFRYLHEASREKLHELVENPEEADLILLIGEWIPKFGVLTRNSQFRKYRSKCAAYYDGGHFLPIVPGVFDSAVQGIHSRMGLVKTSCYAAAFGSLKNEGLEILGEAPLAKRWLFTFMGGSTSLLRKRLYRIDFKRPDVVVEDTSSYHHWDGPSARKLEGQKTYACMLRESHFVLCPRGHGAGTIRLFEVLQMAVAPVLIADGYILPDGPDWDSFLIRVPESRIRQLPQILEERVGDSEELGRRARRAWEQWFSEATAFNHIVASAWQTVDAAQGHQSFLINTQALMIARFRVLNAGYGFARKAILRTMRAMHLKFPYKLNRPE